MKFPTVCLALLPLLSVLLLPAHAGEFDGWSQGRATFYGERSANSATVNLFLPPNAVANGAL